jgi:hypothetical protein
MNFGNKSHKRCWVCYQLVNAICSGVDLFSVRCFTGPLAVYCGHSPHFINNSSKYSLFHEGRPLVWSLSKASSPNKHINRLLDTILYINNIKGLEAYFHESPRNILLTSGDISKFVIWRVYTYFKRQISSHFHFTHLQTLCSLFEDWVLKYFCLVFY